MLCHPKLTQRSPVWVVIAANKGNPAAETVPPSVTHQPTNTNNNTWLSTTTLTHTKVKTTQTFTVGFIYD